MRILIDTTEIRINRLNASIPIYITRYLSTIAIKDRKDYTLLINIYL